MTQRYTVMAQMNGAFGYQLTGVRLEASHLLQMVAGVELVAITSQPQLNGRRGESRSTPPTTHTHTHHSTTPHDRPDRQPGLLRPCTAALSARLLEAATTHIAARVQATCLTSTTEGGVM